MTLQAIYSSPVTPTDGGWSEDVTDPIRLGSITGLAGEAEMGAVGTGNIVLDDPLGTVGHASDGIVGLKSFHFNETACPVGNQRLYTSYVADRTYRRGQDDSLRLGVARKIDVTLTDLNSFLSFRVFAPVASDPTSSFNRPAETSIERIQGLLNDVDFISTTLFDIGYIPTTGGVALDANDYTGSRPIDVLNDIATANKWNFWVLYDEADNQLVLWMDDWKTDGSSTLVYDSALRLTNVASEHDGITTFAVEMDASGTLDPSRLVSAEYGTGTGVTSYRTRPATANTFAWRDGTPVQLSIKTQTKLDAALDLDLVQNSTEDNRISCTVQLPRSKVTGIHEGMRLQVHFTHIPGVQAGMTWTRVLQRTIRQDVETEAFYWLDLELSPMPPTSGYMMSFLIQRSDSAYGADIVPRGTDDGGVTYSDPFTWLGGVASMYPTSPQTGYPMDVAYLEEGPAHTQWIWGSSPSLNGTARPTGFHLILTGATGVPVYLGDYPMTGGYIPDVYDARSPIVVAPDDGIMFCLLETDRAGGTSPGHYTATGPSGVVTLRQTMASDIILGDPGGDTYPATILVYKEVTAGETVEFTFSAVPGGDTLQYLNSLVVFVPGADLAIGEFTHSGSTGSYLAWSW